MPSRSAEANRAAVKRHYNAHPEYYRRRNAGVRERKRAFILAQKARPCTDCGVEYPHCVMEFDHCRGVKLFNIANMTVKSWALIRAEVEKCDVVCANCHCIREARRRDPGLASS